MKNEANLQVRFYVFEQDYPELCEWWRKRPGWEQGVASKTLPQTGFIVFDAATGQKYGAVFLILGESGWTYLEWLVTNPEAPLRVRKKAVDLLLQHGRNYAIEAGAKQVFSSIRTKSRGLVRAFQRAGFIPAEEGMTNMICPVNR